MAMYQYNKLALPDFMVRKPPPNYIAGLGRGAHGFTSHTLGQATMGVGEQAFLTQQATALGMMQKDKDDEDYGGGGQFGDPDQERGLFNSAPYDKDDEEADAIYEAIEAKMDTQRKSKREAREKLELEKARLETPTLEQQFADVKRGLSAMTSNDWAAIPESMNMVHKRGKRQKNSYDSFTPVPDSILISAAQKTALNVNNSETEGTVTDFVKFGQARDKVLSVKLDQVSDSVSGQTTVDPKGYLTDLSSVVVKSDAEISDIKKARMLLRSVISTNPKHAPGWIAAARLEEVAGKTSAARELIAEGCVECGTNEDIWLEAARLNTPEISKTLLAKAVRQVPQSVKLWLRARDLEQDPKLQKQVLRKALENIPNSVKLWKAAISLEDDSEDARILLSRAVECVPLSIELWLALARLETYERAKTVLNKARIAIPTSYEIWITAAKLEESNGNADRVEKIIKFAIADLAKKGASLDREKWIVEAEKCETDGFLAVNQAIISSAIELDVEEDDRKATWIEDAESCVSHKQYQTARAIYAHAIKVFPEKKSIWRRAAYFEKEHGSREALEEILARAVKYVPKAEVLWLMGAKEKWTRGDVPGAKAILEQAFASNPNSEQIWLAAIKLEIQTGQFQRARILLASAREKANTERVWMKSAVLERHQKQFDRAMELLTQGLKQYPKSFKMWLIKGQIQEEQGHFDDARQTYQDGLKQCPKSTPLWLHSSRIEETTGTPIKARSILEKARLLNTKVDELWLEAVRVEFRAGNESMAKALLAKSLQECPSSGLLWSQAILLEPRPQRRARSGDALKKCENDPIVISTIARLFWAERKIEKARNWFRRAVKTEPDYGDAWAFWLKFEMMHGEVSNQDEVLNGCALHEPAHGEEWVKVSKDMSSIGLKHVDILKLVASNLPDTL